MKYTNSLKLLSLTLCLMLWLGFIFDASAQTQTCSNDNSPSVNKSGWTKGETVPVYIDPSITGERRTAIETAFINWNNNSALNGSFVTYQFVSQAPATGTGYTVLNRLPSSGNRADTDTMTNDVTGNTMSATTYISPNMTNPAAVLEAMAHEIGHPAGFGDCDVCAPSASVMATSIRYTNDNDVIGRATNPTDCDNQRLQQGDYPPCIVDFECANSGGIWNSTTCQCENHNYGGGGGGGGGGGYYEYPCTPYYWVYYESWDGGRTWDLVDMEYAGCW